MKTSQLGLFLALSAVYCAQSSTARAAETYQLTDLGAVVGTNSYAQAINNNGQVVGYAHTPNGTRAFLYSGGLLNDLGPLGSGRSYALSINNPGQVVGFSDATNGTRSFLYDQGTVTDLGTLGGLGSCAFGINAAGEIVGSLATAGGARAFLYNASGITDLGTLGGTNSYASGINASTQVTGSSSVGHQPGTQAFLWQNGSLVNLNDLIPTGSGWELQDARGINDHGQIAGWGLLNGQEQGFLFDHGQATGLATLPGGTNSYALGLNNSNQIVGVSSTPNGTTHAFLWQAGAIVDLNDRLPPNTGWELREARGINDFGQIVGWGVFQDGERAFLLTPATQTKAEGGTSQAVAPRIRTARKGFLPLAPPPSGPSSGPVTNSPLADAHVRDGTFTNTNFGTNSILELQKSAGASTNRDIYFKFDISNAPLPLGSAKLHVFAALSNNGSVTSTVYSVTDTNWTETGITWSNKPTLGSTLTNQVFNVKAGAGFDIDVTYFVQGEQAAGRGIITLALHSTNNSTLLTSISSKENNTNAANKPVLILNTNAFPTVSITNITNNSSFAAPTNITISASASDSDGTITNVGFYAGSALLGTDANSPYSIVWTNAPVGTYALTARATDNLGTVSTSAVVNITVTTNLIAVADSYVVSTNVTGNFGSNTNLQAQTNSSGALRDSYMRFDLSPVTNISSAKLRVFAATSATGAAGTAAYSVADTNWGEMSITWSNKPPLSNSLGNVTVSGTTFGWYTIDVTSFVNSEKLAGRNLLSLALHCRTNATIFIKVNSKEASNNQVQLLITTTNSPPAVSITSPANNSLFVTPVNIPISATASDTDGTISQVEFFQGSTSLGVLTNAPYSVTWSNVPSGSYALTARATDNYGLITTSAVVNVTADNAPTVSVTAPTNGANFPAYPTNITLTASASDSDGTISKVEFFQASTSLGFKTNAPYQITWSNVVAGIYALTARATDNLGILSTSSVNTISVDAPPAVTLTSPTNGSSFNVLTNIVLTATASDSDGTVSQVDFYAGTIWIGASQTSPYTVTWSNAPAGIFGLIAEATDNFGAIGSSAIVYITNTFSPTNFAGLSLWLDAGTGLTTNGAGQVSLWADQGGNTNNASQASTPNQPLLVTNALNGRRVVRFDGTNDSFGFQNSFFAGVTQAEVFVVLKTALPVPSALNPLWNFGGGDYLAYPDNTGNIREGFGSWNEIIFGVPSQPLDQYHLYNVASRANDWSARINGIVQYATTNNTVYFPFGLGLGGDTGYYFGGDVAELLIYNRTLSADEREAVGQYLTARYALMPLPLTVSNLTATEISSNQVSLVWSASLTNSRTRFTIERKTGAGGIYGVVATVDNGASYIDGSAAAGTQYFYRVKAGNYAGESGYSNEATATPVVGQMAMPINELVLWLKADAGHGAGYVSEWSDQSGKGNDASQTASASRPRIVEGALSGGPVVRFDGTNDSFGFQNSFFAGVTQAEVFVVLKTALPVPSALNPLWNFGGGDYLAYPDNTGNIREGFGSWNEIIFGVPSQPLDQYHLYNVASRANDWSARINGIVQYATTNNTVYFPFGLGLGGDTGYYFGGDIAELLIYNRTLSDDERNAVGIYLNQRYQFITNAPPAPFGVLVTAVSPTQLSVSWTNTITTVGAWYAVERKLGSGSYSQLGAGLIAQSFLDTSILAGSNYTYRVKAVNYYGDSGYSAEVSPPTITVTNPLPAQVFGFGTNHVIGASASDSDGSVTQVVFYFQTRLLGVLTNGPYSITWTNPIQGGYSLLSKAWDNGGNTRFSAIVSILIALDSDGDGVNDFVEILNGTNPFLADTDGDGVPDGLDAFPLDPGRSSLPTVDPADHSPPVIILDEPSEATPLP